MPIWFKIQQKLHKHSHISKWQIPCYGRENLIYHLYPKSPGILHNSTCYKISVKIHSYPIIDAAETAFTNTPIYQNVLVHSTVQTLHKDNEFIQQQKRGCAQLALSIPVKFRSNPMKCCTHYTHKQAFISKCLKSTFKTEYSLEWSILKKQGVLQNYC